MNLGIQAYCSITEKGLYINGELIKANSCNSFDEFSLELYRDFEIKYSKFHKMDSLCKLTILTADFLLDKGEVLETDNSEDIAIILGNNSSSIVSDISHFNTMNDLPSPAVFVYTLPNIMIGEMCIKYKITGENQCFEMNGFDASFLYKYVSYLFENENYNKCITGFVDFTENGYQGHLFLITQDKHGVIHNFGKDFNILTNTL